MDSVIILRSYWEGIKHLPSETRQKFLESMVLYGLEGIEPEFEGLELSFWISIKSNMDSSIRRYNISVENGKKGGAPSGNSNAKKKTKTTQDNQEQTKTTQEQPTVDSEQPTNNLNKDYNLNKDSDLDSDKVIMISSNIENINKGTNTENLFKHIPGYTESLDIKLDEETLDELDRYLDEFLQSKMS
jgi:hypothetical protein